MCWLIHHTIMSSLITRIYFNFTDRIVSAQDIDSSMWDDCLSVSYTPSVPEDECFVSIKHGIFFQSNSVTPSFNKSISVSVDMCGLKPLSTTQKRFHMTGQEIISRLQRQTTLNDKSWRQTKGQRRVEGGWAWDGMMLGGGAEDFFLIKG